MSWLYDFWTKPMRAEPLALFRIVLGATYLLSLVIGLAPDLDRYQELCPPEGLDNWLGSSGRWSLFRAPAHFPQRAPEDGPLVPPALAEAWNAWGAKRSTVFTAFGVLVIAVFGMTIGWRTRLCTTIAWLLTISFHNRLLWMLNGGDDMFRTALFYLTVSGLFSLRFGEAVAPASAVWSVDRWRQRCKAAPDAPVYIAPWAVRLMQIQLCAVYFFTGLAKIGDDWLNGEALYWVLNDVSVMRWPYHWLPLPLWACRLASWATILWEIGFPLLVAVRWLRPLTLLAGVALHVGILVSMEVGWFSQVTLCWYAVFLSGDSLARVVHWLTRRPQVTWSRSEAVSEAVV
jgi:hypothetical protein